MGGEAESVLQAGTNIVIFPHLAPVSTPTSITLLEPPQAQLSVSSGTAEPTARAPGPILVSGTSSRRYCKLVVNVVVPGRFSPHLGFGLLYCHVIIGQALLPLAQAAFAEPPCTQAYIHNMWTALHLGKSSSSWTRE